MKTYTLVKSGLFALVLSLGSGTALAGPNTEGWKGDARDAWIEGRLETAYLLNLKLNNFRIDPDVHEGKVTLSGTVPSDSDKALAEKIAKSIDEVASVENNLSVEANHSGEPAKENGLLRTWRDSTITTGIAAEFTASSEIEKRNIDIETDHGVVTLNGHVQSTAAKQKAEEIAKSYDHVKEVRNNLIIKTN